ncbi:MAG: hypothetical protein RL637_474 [Pseudomonadota bacterium]|jgi:hypothetical protein
MIVSTSQQLELKGEKMGEVIEISLIMCVVASLAFAPLGYFIYLYTVKKSEPFAEHPTEHAVSESTVKTE